MAKKKTIPEPKSRFFLVKCKECEHEQTLFGWATRKVVCDVCGKPLTEPKGGKAHIIGEVLQELS
ncbi:MAG: 30S ribosomal protein S27e [Candidatus Hermodarchaeota archaeon]